jgi:hypothetical protein
MPMTLAIWVTSALTALEVGAATTPFVGEAVFLKDISGAGPAKTIESGFDNDGC